jgi:hypothetical protein
MFSACEENKSRPFSALLNVDGQGDDREFSSDIVKGAGYKWN